MGIKLAKTMLSMHEVKDKIALNTFIRKYVPEWKQLSVDTTPWCAAIMNAWEKTSGNPGTDQLNARSFLNYGTTIYNRDKKIGSILDSQQGDIVVFERGGSTWLGHVAYLDSIEKNGDNLIIRTIGGNQSDSVSVGWYPTSRLLSIRRYE